ncbi:MAG: MFS transporter [Gammaproteobacteria bacterium]|nr:MFS transporter [Gammaproteobacteria bacterium]
MSTETAQGADAARRHERRILIWMCVLIAANQLGFGGVVPVLPLYAQSFGVTAAAIGLAVAVYGLARVVVAMPSGRLSDWFGRRPTLALGGLVSAIGNLWCGYADTYPEFILARFVAGLGAGLVLTTGQVVLADITTPERRGRTMAIYQGVFIFAVGIGPLPGGWIAEHYGLAAPFQAYAIAGAIAGLVAWFAVAETRDLATATRGQAHARKMPFSSQLRALTQSVGYLLAGAISFANAFARTGALFAIVPVLGAVRLGLSPTQIGLGLALGSIAGLAATFPVGVLLDRYGRKSVIVPATIGAGVSMLLFLFAPSHGWFIGACLTWGVAAAAGGAAPAAYAADSAPPGLNAAAMSTFRMIGDLGYVIGPITLGAIVDSYSSEASLGVAAALLIGVGILFGVLAPETHRAR